MENETNPDNEREDLLVKIEDLKKQIKGFEKELGIETVELKAKWTESDSQVLEKMRESENQLNAIANMVKKGDTQIVEQVPELSAPPGSKIPSTSDSSKPEDSAVAEELRNKTEELRRKSQQIAEISSLVSSLRKNMVPSGQDAKQVIIDTVSVSQKQTLPNQKPVEPPRYSAQDLPSLNLLVQKLSELVNANSAISDELREMINETRNVNKASRVSDLVKKLAMAGLNG